MTALLLSWVLGCGDKPPPKNIGDPMQLAAAAWERRVPFALQAGFAVSVDAPQLGIEGSTRGALVVHRPGKFRVEIFSPLGTPLVYAASDGKAFSIYVVPEKLWLGSDDAEGLLRELTGGSAGLQDFVSLLIGRMPFSDAEVLGRKVQEGNAIYTFGGPEDTKAIVVLDVRSLTNKRIEAYDTDGRMVLSSTYEDYTKVGRSLLPEEVKIVAESIQFEMELEFSSWDELGVIPDAFEIPSPPGSRELDLDVLLEKARLAREQGVKPQSLEELMKVEAPPEPEPEPEPESEGDDGTEDGDGDGGTKDEDAGMKDDAGTDDDEE